MKAMRLMISMLAFGMLFSCTGKLPKGESEGIGDSLRQDSMPMDNTIPEPLDTLNNDTAQKIDTAVVG